MAASTIHKIQATTAPSAWNKKVNQGTTTIKCKQTSTQAQAQYLQPVQDPVPPWDM